MKRLENMQRYKMRWSAIVMSRKTIIRKAFRNIYYNSWSTIKSYNNIYNISDIKPNRGDNYVD